MEDDGWNKWNFLTVKCFTKSRTERGTDVIRLESPLVPKWQGQYFRNLTSVGFWQKMASLSNALPLQKSCKRPLTFKCKKGSLCFFCYRKGFLVLFQIQKY
uniref:Uncharacterized protein n=1 Tax=Cuerna arida TaxID=1464854 RepID=A0A1B6G8P7_9HEMI